MNKASHKLISFLLATTIIFCGSTFYYGHRSEKASRSMQDHYQQSINQLMESLANINSTLKKIRYSTDHALLTTLAADIWRQSETAKTAMSALPLSDNSLEECETFIAQAGDYAYYLMRSTAYETVDEHAWNNLASLATTADQLYTRLDAIKEQVDVGLLTFESTNAMPNETVSGSFSQVESDFPEYGQLIYDGPFSEHIQNRTPLFLKGQASVSQEEARAAATSVLKCFKSDLQDIYQSNGIIPAYGFKKGTCTVSITKTGGRFLSLLDSRQLGPAAISEETAVANAKTFLKVLGYDHMEPTYYLTYESVVTINFAFTKNGTVYYPDLMQVSVALDTGSVTRFDATGYFMNHHDRSFSSPGISISDAKQAIPREVAIHNKTLAVIPTEGKLEKLCYAFTCEHEDGQKLLYYVNANTGHTENLFILIDTGHGTLTM